MWAAPLLWTCLAGVWGHTPPAPAANPALESQRVLAQVKARFDQHLSATQHYRNRVARECKGLPEGDLFPFTLPAMAYGYLALRTPSSAPQMLRSADLLLDMALVQVAHQLGLSASELAVLEQWPNQAVYVCQLNLALGVVRRAGGARDLQKLHHHLSRLIAQALKSASGKPLASFPNASWPFDTLPCLVSLTLAAQPGKGDVSWPISPGQAWELMRDHMDWLKTHGLQASTGLPQSRIPQPLPTSTQGPRGCDLSWRIPLLAHTTPWLARWTYGLFVRHFWIQTLTACGFAEFPDHSSGAADADSGPIWHGIGATASVFGLAAAQAAGDAARRELLAAQVRRAHELRPLVKAVAGRRWTTSNWADDTYTGLLYGDAVLFWALAWSEIP